MANKGYYRSSSEVKLGMKRLIILDRLDTSITTSRMEDYDEADKEIESPVN